MNAAKVVIGVVAVGGLAIGSFVVNREKPKEDESPKVVAAERQQDPKAVVALEKAADAIAEARQVSYDIKLTMGDRTVEGKVKMDFDNGWSYVEAVDSGRPSQPNSEDTFIVASDGDRIVWMDRVQEIFHFGGSAVAAGLLRRGSILQVPEFGGESAFSTELDSTLKYEGKETVDGVECDVVYAEYFRPNQPNQPLGQHARWFIGADGLPRKKVHLMNMLEGIPESQRFERTTELSNVKGDAQLAKADFSLEMPDSYLDNEIIPPAPLLAAGETAPDWTLESSEGGPIHLASMKGQVVVLDFWATWCVPCAIAMPGLEKIHNDYSGKPVKVVGVNLMENPEADPVKFMKDKGFTYPVALRGDAVGQQYNVSGLPSFYVIDQEGNVAYSHVGVSPDGDSSKLVEIIDTLLTDGPGSIKAEGA